MVWKRVLLVGLLVGLAWAGGTSGAMGVESDPDPATCLDFNAELLPYGTKAGGVFVSPGMHTAGLIYKISAHQTNKAFELSAVYPVTGAVPDFDMIAVNAVDHTIQTWQTLGDESGTVPLGAAFLYVYMPIGPDTPQHPGKGTFRFDQC